MSAPAPTTVERLVPAGFVALLGLLLYLAWWTTQPIPTASDLRADAPAYTWTRACASCHGADGLGVTGRGGDVTARAQGDGLLRALEAPQHAAARRVLSGRQVELVAEHLRALQAGAP